MCVDEAVTFFEHHKPIYRKLKILQDVGLGYITLGQSALTFSGGEAQRIKLAKELSRKATGDTLYILDEPTTGLDPITGKEICQLMIDVQKRYNTSSIIISHDMNCVRMTSNRIILLHNGTCYASGTFEELRISNDPIIKEFFE